MTIYVDDLKFQCIIGILDFERVTPQEVIVNLSAEYTYKKEYFINYAEIVDIVKNNLIQNKYYLLEDALNHLIETLCANFSAIEKISIKITKPSILADAKVSVSATHSL